MPFFFGFILTVLAIFLILLVLVQRGRGGGLAGALGGMGGSSAFGAKAGDVFTRITMIVVAIWIVICILVGHWAKHRGDLFAQGQQPASSSSSTDDTTPPQSGPLFPLEKGGKTDAKKGATETGTGDPVSSGPATGAGGGAGTETGTGAAEQPAKTEDKNTTPPPASDK